MGILGVGFILVPRAIGIGAVPEDASTALIAYLKILGSPFLGIAALNCSGADPGAISARTRPSFSPTSLALAWRRLLDVWGLFSGARQLAKVFVVIHLLFAVAFIWARARMSVEVPETRA